MTIIELRRGMKSRLDIDETTTTFDALIDQVCRDAVSRFAPIVYEEVPGQDVTTFTRSDSGQVVVDLSALELDDIRYVELNEGTNNYQADDYRLHAGSLTIREVASTVTSLTVFGLKEYTVETLPKYLTLAVYYYALSEFYAFLLANKAKYNVYMQNNTAAVDDMHDLVEFYERQGTSFLENKATAYGR